MIYKPSTAVMSLLVVFLFSMSFTIYASSLQNTNKNFVLLPGPVLDANLFQKFSSKGAMIEGRPMTQADKLPPALLVSQDSKQNNQTPRQIVFTTKILFNATSNRLFDYYAIPVYHTPPVKLLVDSIYSPPTFLAEQRFEENSSDEGYFILSPIIDRLYKNMTISIDDFPNLSKGQVGIERIKATFAINGEDVGFSLGISQKIPTQFEIPPPKSFNSSLFLNIDYLGKTAGSSDNIYTTANFSNNKSFVSSPEITVIASKSLNAKKLKDGCPIISAGVFDEKTKKWKKVEAIREELLDSIDICAYNLFPGHYSKFAVGGVVPPNQL